LVVENLKILYIVWVPYEVLVSLNEKLIAHVKNTGEVITKEDFNRNIKDNKYSSSIVNKSNKKLVVNSNNSLLYTIISPLEEIYSLKRKIPTMGYSTLTITLKDGYFIH
jgi:hypothetical protein